MPSLKLTSGINKGKSPQTFFDFLKMYEDARKDGWQLPETVTMRDFPNFLNEFCVVLHKPEDILEELNDVSMTVADLEAFCKRNGLEFPSSKKAPASIRKHLREDIIKQREGVESPEDGDNSPEE